MLSVVWPGESSPVLHIELWVKSSEDIESTLYWDGKTRKTFLPNPKELAEVEILSTLKIHFYFWEKEQKRLPAVKAEISLPALWQTDPWAVHCPCLPCLLDWRTGMWDSAISKASLEGKVLKYLALNYHRKKQKEINEKPSNKHHIHPCLQ